MNVLANKKVKTRKPHPCFECSDIIATGTITTIQVYSDEGRRWSIYQCPTCEDLFATNPNSMSTFKTEGNKC